MGKNYTFALDRDSNGNAFEDYGTPMMQDATDTPQQSPITTGTSTITLIAPILAKALFVKTTVDARFADTVGASNGYVTIQANTWFRVPFAANGSSFILRPSTTPLEFVYIK